MNKIDELIARSQELSKKALLGCQPEIYEAMSSLLEDTLALLQASKFQNIETLNEVIRDLLEAQEHQDLYRISDSLGYELPYVLRLIADHNKQISRGD